jgi:hypothetical protein
MSARGGNPDIERTSPNDLTHLCHSTINFAVMYKAAFQQLCDRMLSCD